ncbi:uncharacterized protein LOC118434387 isoform X2 [Folsomia candida]|uniref:Thioredoxin-interacting protein n=1 Tax=Folsomia candida TaxID=158441 RepID=A0A226ERT7_FOLCA|nr:uncharacterized protein LOC118434387 isoform X2 [Folsomia candida]OXA60343.1 Thioredoxin-interacting protein [Folsomia candida]
MSYLNWAKQNSDQLPQMTCELVLGEHEPSSYKAGDTINGHLLLNTSQPFYVYAIRVVLEGYAIVTSEGEKVKSKPDNFLKIGVDVLGQGKILACGEHHLSFAITIHPQNKVGELPGSMQTSHGFITYKLVAYLKQENKSHRQTEKSVSVLGFLNLSVFEPSLMTPVVYEKLQKSSSLSVFPSVLSKSRLKISLRLRKSGFLPGESIFFELNMSNPGNYEIVASSVTLVQKFTYNSGTTQKVQLFEIRSIETKVLQGSTALWADSVIMDGCDGIVVSQSGIIIEISHFLKVRIKTNGPDEHFLMEVPLKIGSTKRN